MNNYILAEDFPWEVWIWPYGLEDSKRCIALFALREDAETFSRSCALYSDAKFPIINRVRV